MRKISFILIVLISLLSCSKEDINYTPEKQEIPKNILGVWKVYSIDGVLDLGTSGDTVIFTALPSPDDYRYSTPKGGKLEIVWRSRLDYSNYSWKLQGSEVEIIGRYMSFEYIEGTDLLIGYNIEREVGTNKSTIVYKR